jgi:hypothetical protein
MAAIVWLCAFFAIVLIVIFERRRTIRRCEPWRRERETHTHGRRLVH